MVSLHPFPQPFSWDILSESSATDLKWRKWEGCLGDERMAKRQCPGITNNLAVLVRALGSCVLTGFVSACLVFQAQGFFVVLSTWAHDDSNCVVDTDLIPPRRTRVRDPWAWARQ